MTRNEVPASSTLEGIPQFSLRHRVDRLAWKIVWALFGRWTPVPLHGWRRFLLRAFGAKIDPTAKVYPSARVWMPRNLEMAAYSCLADRVECYNMAKVTLGRYALASQRATLCAGGHEVDDPGFALVTSPITLGERAWVAAEAFVGPGVTVGEGAVLGARGVAFRNLDRWTIYAGNPARALRRRFQGTGEPPS